jgi:ABC-2 type transport system permease protein
MSAERFVANARVAFALGKRSVRQAFRRPQFLMPIVIFPSLFLAVNTGGAQSATEIPGFPNVHGFLDFELAGAMLQSTMLAGVSGGIALAMDIEMGFIDRLFAAPIARTTVVIGRLAATAVFGVFTALWFLAVGLLFGARIEGGVPGAVLILVMTPLIAGAFGGLGAALALKAGRASVVQGIFPLVFVILFLSSAFFPRNLLNQPAKGIADLNPMSLLAEGLRGPIIDGVTLEAIGKAAAGIGIVGAIGVGLSALALRARLRAG